MTDDALALLGAVRARSDGGGSTTADGVADQLGREDDDDVEDVRAGLERLVGSGHLLVREAFAYFVQGEGPASPPVRSYGLSARGAAALDG